jgi:hypothetical protein
LGGRASQRTSEQQLQLQLHPLCPIGATTPQETPSHLTKPCSCCFLKAPPPRQIVPRPPQTPANIEVSPNAAKPAAPARQLSPKSPAIPPGHIAAHLANSVKLPRFRQLRACLAAAPSSVDELHAAAGSRRHRFEALAKCARSAPSSSGRPGSGHLGPSPIASFGRPAKRPVLLPAMSGIAPGFRREPLQTLGLRNFRPPNRPSRRRCLLCCRQSIAEPLAVGRLARSPLEKRNGCQPNATARRSTTAAPAVRRTSSIAPVSSLTAEHRNSRFTGKPVDSPL